MARIDTPTEQRTHGHWGALGSSLASTLGSVVNLVRGRNAPPAELEHPEIRFEPTDLKSRSVIYAGFGILGVMWLCVFGLFFYYRAGEKLIPQASVSAPPLAIPEGTLPPEPRLQISPRTDYQGELAYENSQLEHYAWVDKNGGIVTIPIEQAMQIIAQRGIPPQTAPPELKLYPPQAGTRDTGFEGKIAPEPR